MYNIGSQYEISNFQLAYKLIELFAESRGEDAKAAMERDVIFVGDRQLNDRRYAVNYQKLLSLGWRQTVEFSQGIRKTSK